MIENFSFTISDSDSKQSLIELNDWINTHAVPKYFTSTTLNTTSTPYTLSMYVDDFELLRVYYNSLNAVVVIYNKNKTSNSCTIGNAHVLKYIKKCNNGFMINIANESYKTQYNYYSIFVCKTNLDETAVIMPASISYTIYTNPQTFQMYCGSTNSSSIKTRYCVMSGCKSQKTVLCPIIIDHPSDDGCYLKNTYFMPYSQYPEANSFVIDGVKYISNSYLAIKDE